MKTLSANAQAIGEGFRDYMAQQWKDYYEQGYRGQEFSGTTYYGYYGWCAGRDAKETENHG